MVHDIEKALGRELREVADGLHVPPMPSLPDGSSGRVRRRAPLLAAAAVVAVIAAATGVLTSLSEGPDTEPAQPSPAPSATPSSAPSATPSPSQAASPAPIPRAAPAVPYVLDRRLFVDGEQVPGDDWWSVEPAGESWVGVRGMPLTWWWGRDAEPHQLPSGDDVNPAISPNGDYVAVVQIQDGQGILTVIDTESGRHVEGTPTNFGEVRPAEGAYVVAVTDDGRVVVRRGNTYSTWSADLLASTLSGQMVLDSTSAGVVAGDVDDGQPYLAELADNGALTHIADLPEHDDLLVSPGATWLAWTPAGTTGGDVTAVPSLQVRQLNGVTPTTLTAPAGWQFVVRTYAWEDDAYLVSAVSSPGHDGQRMARCSAEQARCVLLPAD